MGRCHVLWFPFLFSLLVTRRYPSLLFWSLFLLVIFIWRDLPPLDDGFSSNLEVDHRKWEPCGSSFTFKWVLLVFPFYESTRHASFWFAIVIPSQVFPSCPSVPHQKGFRVISLKFMRCIFKSVFIYLILFTFSWFPSMLFHGILFWLGFFPSV